MIIIHISELLFKKKVMKTDSYVTYCFHRNNMLPEDVKKKNIKIVHVSRDPRDVAVSYYRLSKMMTAVSYQGTWDAFFKDFTEGNLSFGSWFDYTQDWMKYKSDPYILYITYEGFLDDTTGTIKGTHTIYFSSSLYIINQKPMIVIPRTHFHCITTWLQALKLGHTFAYIFGFGLLARWRYYPI